MRKGKLYLYQRIRREKCHFIIKNLDLLCPQKAVQAEGIYPMFKLIVGTLPPRL